MKKKSFSEKLADKFASSDKFNQAWDIHMQTFGPIMKDAFKDDSHARINLVNVLNHASKGELNEAVRYMDKLKEKITCDEDNACWLFFMGLIFDMAGMKENMLEYYYASCEYRHKFYMPYLKIAKSAHADRAFDSAEDAYKYALFCFSENGLMEDSSSKVIIASIYTQLASVLTSMHRFDEAEDFITLSEEMLPSQPGRNATKAVLYAATGRKEEAYAAIEEVKKDSPQFAESTLDAVQNILSGTFGQFSAIETDEKDMRDFWQWFSDNEKDLYGILTQERYDEFFTELGGRLRTVFPFMKESFESGVRWEDDKFIITFADFYATALYEGYTKLIALCPDELKTRWDFYIDR